IFQKPNVDRRYIDVMRFIEAKMILISDKSINDSDIQSVVQNKEKVLIDYESSVTWNGIAWVYEKMRDRHLDLKFFVAKMKNTEDVWAFMESIGNFNRETLGFTPTNAQRVKVRTVNEVIVEEGNLEIFIKGIEANVNGEI
ncbi:hypothetical protein PENTCL1PPCAC_13152, partial [Pristionchus entomophagus]